MTNCAVCPSSQCINRSTIGLPPASTSSQTLPSSGLSNNSGLIGGIVGGLAGVGILIGIGVYCYIKRAKKKRKLPFAFTDGGMGIMSQEKFQPHPSVAATLTQQQPQQQQPSEPNRYISLSELASSSSPAFPTSPTLQYNTNRSNMVVSPISNNNIYNQSTSVHDVPVHNNNNNNNRNSINTNSTHFITELMPSPVNNIPVVPEEFEERIAIQNKRISQILNNNPRLSRGSAFNQPAPPLPVIENRMSGVSFTTDDESEYDDDDRSVSSHQPQLAVRSGPQSASQAVQVTRAKAQIMRVNSVRSNNGGGGGGLGRSDSVRTILTSVHVPPVLPQLDLASDSIFTDSFPATPNNRSVTTIEDPFVDTKK